MEYEAYEPDPEDEYYDAICKAAYARMFERSLHDLHDSQGNVWSNEHLSDC